MSIKVSNSSDKNNKQVKIKNNNDNTNIESDHNSNYNNDFEKLLNIHSLNDKYVKINKQHKNDDLINKSLNS